MLVVIYHVYRVALFLAAVVFTVPHAPAYSDDDIHKTPHKPLYLRLLRLLEPPIPGEIIHHYMSCQMASFYLTGYYKH